MRGGTPLRRWHAHLVKPFVSREFAWLIHHNTVWHLEIMLGVSRIREVAIYHCETTAMKHVERWIAARSRWERTVLALGAEDPRGRFDRFAPNAFKHHLAMQLREMWRGAPTRLPARPLLAAYAQEYVMRPGCYVARPTSGRPVAAPEQQAPVCRGYFWGYFPG